MPDGQSVLFLAKRGEHTSIYRLPMNGGEAKAFDLKVTPIVDESKRPGALPPKKADAKEEKAEPVAIDVAGFRVAPDGKTIALIANDPETPGEKKDKEAKADAEWVDHGLHGTRLYLLDVASNKLTVTGVAMDVRGASWSADSSKLVVIREEPNGASEIGPANSAVVVTASDPGHAVKIDEVPATVSSAEWSVDGSALYFLAQAKRDAPPGYEDLYVDTVETKAIRNLSDGFDGSLGRMEPLALKAGGVLEAAEVGVEQSLIRYTAEGKGETLRMPAAVVAATSTNQAQSGWVFVANSGGKLPELLYTATLGDAPKMLATPSLIPEGVKTVAPKRISWPSGDKAEKLRIDGMLYLPPEAATKKVPLIVEVHGGPLGAYLNSYSVFTDFLLGPGMGGASEPIRVEARAAGRSLPRRIRTTWAGATIGM